MVSSSSLITKKIIAYSLKDLLKSKDFSKISIKEIMHQADYRRQTFYDYFSDKEELLRWIYQQELSEVIDDFINYESTEKIIARTLQYLETNKLFYQKTLHAIPEPQVNAIFIHSFNRLLKSTFSAYSEKGLPESVTTMYSYALLAIIKEWLFTNCELKRDDLEIHLLTNLNWIIKNSLADSID